MIPDDFVCVSFLSLPPVWDDIAGFLRQDWSSWRKKKNLFRMMGQNIWPTKVACWQGSNSSCCAKNSTLPIKKHVFFKVMVYGWNYHVGFIHHHFGI